MTRSSFGLVAQWLVCKSGDTCWCCWYRSWRGGGSEKCNTTLVEVTVTVLLLVWEERAERQDFKVRHLLCPVHWQVLFTSTMSSRNILCNFGSYMTREDWNERFEPFIMSLLYFLLSDASVNKPYSTSCKFAQAQLISSSHNKPDHRTL